MMVAAEQRYSVGAFNVTSLVQMRAVLEAADENRSPVIVQTSVTPAKFFGPATLAAAFRALAGPLSVPAALHIDHCTDVGFCQECANAGYTNLMIDASSKPLEENISQTKTVVEIAHGLRGVSVEGELGTVGGVEDQVRLAEDEATLCNPDDAERFVAETGVDIFAPAIGTAHGIYKTSTPRIDVDRFAEINRRLNGRQVTTPLVVHGGTGLSDEIVRRLVESGGAKFNVSTHLKHALIDATADYLEGHRADYDPGKLDLAVLQATKSVVSDWMKLLDSIGRIE